MTPFPVGCRARRARRGLAFACVLACAVPEPLKATGFFINQQSVRGLGRVDAGNTVAAEDLGTIFFNPAGLPLLVFDDEGSERRILTSIGMHLIVARGTQRNRASVAASPGSLGGFVPVGGGNARNTTDPTPVLNLYAGGPFRGSRAAWGLGLTTPFGLATRFSPDWHGRYDAIDASLLTFNVSAVGAYRFDSGLSVGGGLDVQYAKTRLVTAIPSPLAPGGPSAGTDGRIETEGDAVTPGYNVGLLYGFDNTRIGIHYRSGMKHSLSGTSTLSNLAPPLEAFNGTVDARADLELPAITTVGARTMITRNLVLLGEFEWFDWSVFREVRIQFADGRPDGVRATNYRDAYAVAAGAEYPIRDAWTLRSGIHYDTTPTVDGFRDTTVPDADRLWLGVGASVAVSPRMSFDVAFNHVFFRDTTVAVTRTFFESTPLATTAVVDSDVTSVVNTFSFDFRYRF